MTRQIRSSWVGVLLAAIFLLADAPPARAHQQLLASVPAQGDTLRDAPRQLRLTFNQAVEPALAGLRLVGPAGEVPLSPLRISPDRRTVLLADIPAALGSGDYVVHWLATGDDGHAVRGEIGFHVAAAEGGLAGAASPAEDGTGAVTALAPPAAPQGGEQPAGTGEFGSGSLLYAVIRWLTFSATVAAIGAVAFGTILLPQVLRSRPSLLSGMATAKALRRAANIGVAAGLVLLIAAAPRLLAQTTAMAGAGDGDAGSVASALITQTVWGTGWMLQVAGAAAAILGFGLARRLMSGGWILAVLAALALALSPALSGHAAATSTAAVIADALHVLAAGGWLGTLLVLMFAGFPLYRDSAAHRHEYATALLGAFSPLALGFAALLTLTGLFSTSVHLPDLDSLVSSAYGRTLLLKIGFLAVVFGAGARNWLRVRPALERGGDLGPLRRTATLELTMAAIVLAVTAALVATPPPMEAPAAGSQEDAALEAVLGSDRRGAP